MTNKAAVAGTLESSDVMVRIVPTEQEPDVEIEIRSVVMRQYGKAIEKTAREMAEKYQIKGCKIYIDDKGAIDCVLAARLLTAIMRSRGEEA